jgi:hypothetical protein
MRGRRCLKSVATVSANHDASIYSALHPDGFPNSFMNTASSRGFNTFENGLCIFSATNPPPAFISNQYVLRGRLGRVRLPNCLRWNLEMGAPFEMLLHCSFYSASFRVYWRDWISCGSCMQQPGSIHKLPRSPSGELLHGTAGFWSGLDGNHGDAPLAELVVGPSAQRASRTHGPADHGQLGFVQGPRS